MLNALLQVSLCILVLSLFFLILFVDNFYCSDWSSQILFFFFAILNMFLYFTLSL
jgi:hypothetical protein